MRLKLKKAIQLIVIIMIGIFLVATVVVFARQESSEVLAAAGPIPPPVGYPKLSLSTKVVTPTLANVDSATLEYTIEVLNTGAYRASSVSLMDAIPNHTVFKGVTPPAVYDGVLNTIKWNGAVEFDASVLVKFSVTVNDGYEGLVTNTAVISDPMIAEPVTVTAETRVTDHPVFEITKSATPALPGASKPLTYELVVTNVGQVADNTPITVTDYVPADTLNPVPGQGGVVSPDGDIITWKQPVSLETGDSTAFTFTVDVADVPSGTVLHNGLYLVDSGPYGFSMGEPYTTTVIDPILLLSKSIYPDPPGSNREMTYTLTVLNLGSEATSLVITDTVPSGVIYQSGGDSLSGGVVTWHLDSLDTRESAQVSFTVFVPDIAAVTILNNKYGVRSAEGVRAQGIPTPSLIVGPTFKVTASLDPIAHKPGSGGKEKEPVTPTLTIKNEGPGNAIDANALLIFGNISVSNVGVLKTMDSEGNPVGELFTVPNCMTWSKCVSYGWIGSLGVGDMITITTIEGQSTIGGEEWNPYTATVVVTDVLGTYTTEPFEATAIGHVTHMSNLIPEKSAPHQVGPGQTMTYLIEVFNSGLSTTEPPSPVLTETLPVSVTLVPGSISDAGTSHLVGDRTVISWTLPAMSPGDYLSRTFEVTVNSDLISGTLLVNKDYATTTYEDYLKGFKTIVGEPVTTTIHEVGLIDSYKEVTPTWALPGTDTVLTWTVHVVNTGPGDLSGVEVTDIFPWQHSTYQRDAIPTLGATSLISDIISFEWTGNVAHDSEQLITFTTLVDDLYEGPLTNTATIHHASLKQDVVVTAVAYITNKPVLRISKIATPDPVLLNNPLLYQIQVANLGAQATMLVVTDTIPANTSYVLGSASSGALVEGNVVKWILPVIDPGKHLKLTFQVTPVSGNEVVNESYAVRCNEGVFAYGEPVVTHIRRLMKIYYLPLIYP